MINGNKICQFAIELIKPVTWFPPMWAFACGIISTGLDISEHIMIAFIGILFSSSLFIEVIFSLDGLGLLGYEAALTRDYPVIFATLYFFSLLGLIMVKII